MDRQVFKLDVDTKFDKNEISNSALKSTVPASYQEGVHHASYGNDGIRISFNGNKNA